MSITDDSLRKSILITSVIFFVAAMTVIVYFAVNKTIEIANVAQDSVSGKKADEGKDAGDTETDAEDTAQYKLQNLLVFEEEGSAEYLCIPLPDKSDADQITIENHYMDSELVVHIGGAESSFYAQHPLTGNRKSILSGIYEENPETGVSLKLTMDGIYEYKTILENNNLYISFLNPREIYDRIVVIDPSAGGADPGETGEGLSEKEIALDVTKRLKEKLDESGIKTYYTRMDDVNPSAENRVRLANDTHADLYIVIGVERNDDPSIYGVSATYNDEYFIPGFGSIELSDILLRNVTTDVKGKALGLRKAALNEYTIRNATVPVSKIGVGCISNKQEALLLAREDYREKIAQGIFDAIMEVYEEK